MRKKYIFITLLIMLAVAMSACAPATTRTDKDENYIYSAGETINIYDKESGQKLGDIVITNVSVISDEPFEINMSPGKADPSIIKYEGLIQVCYKYSVADSSVDIDYNNFKVEDYCGEDAFENPDVYYEAFDTDDEYFVSAVKNLGTYVDIEFSFHTYQTPTAKAHIEYSDPGVTASKARHGNNAADEAESVPGYVTVIVIAGFLLVVLGVTVFLVKYNRAKRKAVYTAMEGMPLAEADGNGGYVAVKQFCPYCGSRHAPGAKKCPVCSRELD